jgi:predicted NBD/HSP70 family sugar kinase
MSAVLVVDVGGSHIKVLATGEQESRRADSGPGMSAEQMVEAAKDLAGDWSWESASVGVPSPVHGGRVVAEPVNLGDGWVGFDYEAAFGKPTKVVNDAAMQALGSYEGGRMLFIGLGTGVGSALVANGFVQPMELGHLPYNKATFEDRQCRPGEARQEAVARRRCRHRRQAERGLGARLRRAGRWQREEAERAAGERETRRQRRRVHRWVPALGSRGARPDRGLSGDSQTAVEAEVPLTCAARSHRRSPQSMQRGSTRRTITVLPQAAHRNQPLVATPAGQNST